MTKIEMIGKWNLWHEIFYNLLVFFTTGKVNFECWDQGWANSINFLSETSTNKN